MTRHQRLIKATTRLEECSTLLDAAIVAKVRGKREANQYIAAAREKLAAARELMETD
jgi:hypothetical protein